MKKLLTFLFVLFDITLLAAGYGGKMFSRWRTPMRKHGFTWDAVPAKTDDGWEIILFRITGTEAHGKYKGKRPVVLIMPGLYQDAGQWLQQQTGEDGDPLPFMLQLAEAGYDVWVGNNRGTEYSQTHKHMAPHDPEFWNFQWETMAEHDVYNMMRRVKELTGMHKIFYIGYSQGAAMMFTALAEKNPDLKRSLHKFVALAPCVTAIFDKTKDESYYENSLYKFPQYGIHSLYDRYFWSSNLKKICAKFSQEVCDEYTNVPEGRQATSTRNLIYWLNNHFQNRFQMYAPNYLEGEKHTELFDVDSIRGVRISMFVPENDEYCTFDQLKNVKTETTKFMPVPHSHFATGGKDQEFMKALLAELKIAPGDEEHSDEL